jgi:hypothetical protein
MHRRLVHTLFAPSVLAVLVACLCTANANDPPGIRQEAVLIVDGDAADISFRDVSIEGGRWFYGTWRGEERARRIVQGLVPVGANRWGTAMLRFTPAASGTVRLALTGRNRAGSEDPTPESASAVVWDAVAVTGATLANGGFEDGDGAIPADWRADKPDAMERIREPLLVRTGAAAVRIMPGAWLSQPLAVEAGCPVTVTAWALRPVGPQTLALDLSTAANMGLRDEQADDGQGGWTDQGRANDLASLPVGEQVLADVRFLIATGPKAAIVLRGPSRPGMPEKAELPLPPGARGRILHLLHAGAWARSLSGEIGRIVPVRADGSEAPAIPVVGGRDVGDWWAPAGLDNAHVAWTADNASAYIGLYVSRFELPEGPLRALRFESANSAVWGIVGASLGVEAVPFPKTIDRTMAADDTWRPIAMHRDIVADSALDFSGLLDAPAGRRGFVGIADGRLVFADGTRARFSGNNFSPMNPKTLLVADDHLVRLAERFARMGINLVRVSHLDAVVRSDASGGPQLVPEVMERFDFLVAELKKRGIYVTFELCMGRWTQAVTDRRFPGYSQKGGHSRNAYMAAFPIDAEFREDLKTWTRSFLTHVNPYTGLAYVEEPAVVFVGMNNEDPLPSLLQREPGTGIPSEIAVMYARAFADALRRTHAADDDLRAAWNGALDPAEGLAAGVRIDLAATGKRGEDTLRFLVEVQAAAWAEMEAFVRDLGLRVPFTDCNMTNNRFAALLRTHFALVDNHTYFDHPKFPRKEWSLPYAYHQRAQVRAGRWWSRENLALEMAASRHVDKPFVVSEYDHVFPNRHRSEAGIVFGGIAALQDWDGIMQFTYGSDPNSLYEGEFHAKAFDLANEPISQATEAQVRLLYLRGDLQPAPGRVELHATPARLLAADWGLGPDSDLLAFVTRTGLRIADRPTPDALTLPLHPGTAGEGLLPRAGGVDPDQLAAWFMSVKARILPPGNRSDPAAGIMESATGELRWEFHRGRVLVDSPRSRGAVVKSAGETIVNGMRAEIDAEIASLTVHSLDAEPLERSHRLLVILATDVLNEGMRLEDSDRLVVTWGSSQKLLRTGRARLFLDRATPLRAWALDTAGRRIAEVPATFADGRLELELDQRQHVNLYWELAE